MTVSPDGSAFERMTSAVVAESVAAAVAAQVERSTLRRRAAEAVFWEGTRQEVERLRLVVAEQAARIADLENRLAEAQRQISRLEVADMIDAVTDAVLAGVATYDGYVVSDAHVQVRAALELDAGRLTVNADPGGLLDAGALSSFDLHLRSLPPSLGEDALSSALSAVRGAAAQLQAVLADDSALEAATRAAALSAVTDLVSDPGAPAAWEALVPATEAIVPLDDRVADSALAVADRARGVVAHRTASTLLGAGEALRAFADDLGQLRD